jgi:hypothetical protein
MSEQNPLPSHAAVVGRGGVVFVAGMALAAASIVAELAILRYFSK